MVFYIFRIFSVFISILIIENVVDKENIRTAPEYTNYSFWVYCVHFPFISLYTMMFEKIFDVEGSLFELLEYFSTVIIVYSGAVLFAMILRRYVPYLWKILNGGREKRN